MNQQDKNSQASNVQHLAATSGAITFVANNNSIGEFCNRNQVFNDQDGGVMRTSASGAVDSGLIPSRA